MMAKDGWLQAAMTEDTMVAELLVRIKQGHALAPIKPAAVDLPPPRWGVRYLRSRLTFTCSPIKGVDYRRNSPKTPLSWATGTTSSSGTADGFEDTDLPGCGSSRSKRNSSNDECVSPSATIKSRSRRKKSFEEEEEMLVGTEKLVEEEEEMVILKKKGCLKDEGSRKGRVMMKRRMKVVELGTGGAEVVVKKESGNGMLPDLNLMPNGED